MRRNVLCTLCLLINRLQRECISSPNSKRKAMLPPATPPGSSSNSKHTAQQLSSHSRHLQQQHMDSSMQPTSSHSNSRRRRCSSSSQPHTALPLQQPTSSNSSQQQQLQPTSSLLQARTGPQLLQEATAPPQAQLPLAPEGMLLLLAGMAPLLLQQATNRQQHSPRHSSSSMGLLLSRAMAALQQPLGSTEQLLLRLRGNTEQLLLRHRGNTALLLAEGRLQGSTAAQPGSTERQQGSTERQRQPGSMAAGRQRQQLVLVARAQLRPTPRLRTPTQTSAKRRAMHSGRQRSSSTARTAVAAKGMAVLLLVATAPPMVARQARMAAANRQVLLEVVLAVLVLLLQEEPMELLQPGGMAVQPQDGQEGTGSTAAQGLGLGTTAEALGEEREQGRMEVVLLLGGMLGNTVPRLQVSMVGGLAQEVLVLVVLVVVLLELVVVVCLPPHIIMPRVSTELCPHLLVLEGGQVRSTWFCFLLFLSRLVYEEAVAASCLELLVVAVHPAFCVVVTNHTGLSIQSVLAVPRSLILPDIKLLPLVQFAFNPKRLLTRVFTRTPPNPSASTCTAYGAAAAGAGAGVRGGPAGAAGAAGRPAAAAAGGRDAMRDRRDTRDRPPGARVSG